MMFGLALGQSFSHQMQSMVRNESFTRQLNVLRGKPLFFRSARTSCTTSGGPVRPQETQTFLCRPFRPKSAITMWAIKHCLVERGVNSCPDDLEHFYIKKKQHLAKKYPRVPVRGGICPYRHCRQQCKIFASVVNFSIFTFFVFFPTKTVEIR